MLTPCKYCGMDLKYNEESGLWTDKTGLRHVEKTLPWPLSPGEQNVDLQTLHTTIVTGLLDVHSNSAVYSLILQSSTPN
jgi:hypothetical protein